MQSPEESQHPSQPSQNKVEGAEQMMSPEEFDEMMSQIPALREMLEERKFELAGLGEDTYKNKDRKRELEGEIEELKTEISLREELMD